MTQNHDRGVLSTAIAALMLILIAPARSSAPASPSGSPSVERIWARNNLVGWEVAPYDSKMRSPEERAQMLKRLGIRHYAYLPSRVPVGEDVGANHSQLDIDAEIEAMQRHGIDVLAWYFWVNVDDPAQDLIVRKTFESFKHHHIHPQIWVSESFADQPETPKTAEQYRQRVEHEADRIRAFVKLAAPYGCQVNIYNHRAWFGYIDNELAILERLRQMGVSDVGMVYNFSHSRDRYHVDSKDFPRLWQKMKAHVVAVNITGISQDGAHPLYPSQGDGEFEMMGIIEKSGWRGPIGLLGDKWGDAETTLRKTLIGLQWIAAELESPGSGGPKPVLPVP